MTKANERCAKCGGAFAPGYDPADEGAVKYCSVECAPVSAEPPEPNADLALIEEGERLWAGDDWWPLHEWFDANADRLLALARKGCR